ncbi:MAG: hypothetical protein HN712_15425 [Gemmatimonadetes bacterium]|jgi:hypothetical protein|nr:hypothetical protein [Gemmatimonadota bacterium]MBT7861712.1 hypothetical protein [Gemmatimonadota bacterium]
MASTANIPALISSAVARVLDAQPSASVQLRIARDVLGDDNLTDLASARCIPENHPARAILRNIEFSESDVWMKPDVGGGVRGGVDDAFRAALNAGLTQSDPLMQERIAETATFIELCEEETPWEDEALHGQKRHTKFGYITDLPGALSCVAPSHPIVVRYRDMATQQIKAHLRTGDFSVESEEALWPGIYGTKLASTRFFEAYRQYDFWNTHHPHVFGWHAFRLVGSDSSGLTEKERSRYYDMAVGYKEWGGTEWTSRIIAHDFPKPDRYAQAVALQFEAFCDMQLYPYWRRNAALFVEWVVDQRRPDGLWDFGVPHNGFGSATLAKISESWRGRHRALDWTTHVLLLLKRYMES